ncbi:MAG: hypothetical protein JO131_05790 [Gammaproteobacteria bacterium]|nr:hypothetical protein [Gammaproteobacteria bacterium]
MTIFAIIKANFDLHAKESHYHSKVKIQYAADITKTEKYQKFLESKECKNLEIKFKQNIRRIELNRKKETERRERKENESKAHHSFFKKLNILTFFNNKNQEPNQEDNGEINFISLTDTTNNAYHHITILSSELYVIVTDSPTFTETLQKVFTHMCEIEENFSNLKKDKREKIETALQNTIKTHNYNEAKKDGYSFLSTKTDSSCLFLCCGCDVDETPSSTYKRLN